MVGAASPVGAVVGGAVVGDAGGSVVVTGTVVGGATVVGMGTVVGSGTVVGMGTVVGAGSLWAATGVTRAAPVRTTTMAMSARPGVGDGRVRTEVVDMASSWSR